MGMSGAALWSRRESWRVPPGSWTGFVLTDPKIVTEHLYNTVTNCEHYYQLDVMQRGSDDILIMGTASTRNDSMFDHGVFLYNRG